MAEDRKYARLVYEVELEGTGEALGNCPTENMVRNAVSERLGYIPWRPEAPMTVETTFKVRSDIIHAHIAVLDETGALVGERHIRSRENCMEVAKAVELAVAIAIDPLSIDRVPEVADETASEAPEETAPEKVTETTECPEVPPPVDRDPTLLADVGGLGAWRTAPSITGSIIAGLRMRWETAALGLIFRFDFPASKDLRPGTLSAHQILVELAPCFHFRYALACGVITGGVLRTDVSGLVDAKRATLPSLSAGIRAGVEIPVGSMVTVRLFADMPVSLIRNTLRETGTGELFWKTPPFALVWGVALGIIFFDGKSTASTIVQ
jgi:hypothetical protein